MPAETIDAVLEQLDEIIARSRAQESRMGYFASLYRAVTARVKNGIASGRFDYPVRMEELDVRFANRYLLAVEAFRKGESASICWETAFDATTRWHPLILQHLALGMNAHINLDLGISTAETASDSDDLQKLRNDFWEINAILGELIDLMQDRVARVSPWVGALDYVGGRSDEIISNFCLLAAREDAWSFAQALVHTAPDEWPPLIAAKDQETNQRSKDILQPGGTIALPLLWVLRLRESQNITRVIDTLSEAV